MCKSCSKLTIKTSEQCQVIEVKCWLESGFCKSQAFSALKTFLILGINQNLLIAIHAGWHIVKSLVSNGTLRLWHHFVWKHKTTKMYLFDPCGNISECLILDISFLLQSSKRRISTRNIFFNGFLKCLFPDSNGTSL